MEGLLLLDLRCTSKRNNSCIQKVDLLNFAFGQNLDNFFGKNHSLTFFAGLGQASLLGDLKQESPKQSKL
jgi:hypothetical protein